MRVILKLEVVCVNSRGLRFDPLRKLIIHDLDSIKNLSRFRITYRKNNYCLVRFKAA